MPTERGSRGEREGGGKEPRHRASPCPYHIEVAVVSGSGGGGGGSGPGGGGDMEELILT